VPLKRIYLDHTARERWDFLKRWDRLTNEEKKLFIRQADVFAAYRAYSDHEIGWVVDEIEKTGRLDDTLISYVAGG
jgi:arylsulfatase